MLAPQFLLLHRDFPAKCNLLNCLAFKLPKINAIFFYLNVDCSTRIVESNNFLEVVVEIWIGVLNLELIKDILIII